MSTKIDLRGIKLTAKGREMVSYLKDETIKETIKELESVSGRQVSFDEILEIGRRLRKGND